MNGRIQPAVKKVNPKDKTEIKELVAPPVQQATKFEFVINLKAAKQISLTIPVRVLERANVE